VVLERKNRLQPGLQEVKVEQVPYSDASVGRFVAINGPYAPARSPQATFPFPRPVEKPVVRPDNMRPPVDPEVVGFDSSFLQCCDFIEQGVWVDHGSCPVNANNSRVEDAGGNQVKLECTVIIYDSMPGIVATLKPDNKIRFGGEIIYNSALSFVAELRSDDYSARHTVSPSLGQKIEFKL
jgi:hypothetical protein